MEEQIINMPAVALRGLTILPGMIAHFDVSRERSLRAIEEAMEQNQKIYLVTQKNVDRENPTQDRPWERIVASAAPRTPMCSP